MEQNLTDGRAGMNRQAHVLMVAMAHEEIELPPGYYLSTRPYCNCREMGFVISLSRPKLDSLNFAFFEHRNSDMLCALRWEGRLPINGGVTSDDVPPTVYPDKWSVTKEWPRLSIADAIVWTLAEIDSAIPREDRP